MQTRGRRVRFTAVLVLVVLALTGFSSGRGRGGSHGHGGGGGGGCSSSSQDHDRSRSSTSSGISYGSGGSSGGSHGSDDDDHGSSGGGSSSTRRPDYGSTPTSSSSSGSGSRKALEDGTARLVSCATSARPYATVEVSNPNGRKAGFSVSVTFEDAQGITVVSRYGDVTVPANGRATVDVRVGGSGLVDSVDHCEVDRQALVDD
ncbi:hypothetical protein [Streptomyces sp. AK010]|uniref:hypothetical protein n=1 Tax=Streptomyces sp. AK010 TaxID=2723074 RepID=UPI0016215C44|nr:hypothetical protein [Streptomyces sp. AK010]MBB6415384.1 hypothetical protein [Streptomyces sp. AK010]